MQSLTLINAYITPTKVSGNRKPYTLSGCVYDSDENKVQLSERYKGNLGEVYITKNPDSLNNENVLSTERLTGESIYLGHMMSHYGHFITETISTFWVLIQEHSYDQYVFQSFEGSEKAPEFATLILKAFGIPKDKIRVIQKTTIVEKLTIPERLHEYNNHINPGALAIYEHLKKYILSNYKSKFAPSHIYLSRKKNSKRKCNRSIINEPFLENILTKLGFTTVYIEELALEQQILLMHEAQVVIGFSGSALHNCVFMQTDAYLIELADSRSSKDFIQTQNLLNDLSNIQTDTIPFKGHVISEHLHLSFADLSYIQETIKEKLGLKLTSNYSGIDMNSFIEVIYIYLKSFIAKTKYILRK